MIDRKKTGTGFTNINKIYEANKGNQLGQVVSSGIQDKTQQVGQSLSQAQSGFMTDAEKNRLDSEEAKQKRQSVLGRFDQSKYAPDETKFAASSGLQTSFKEKQKSFQEAQLKKARESSPEYSAGRSTAPVTKPAIEPVPSSGPVTKPVNEVGLATQGTFGKDGQQTAPVSKEIDYAAEIKASREAQQKALQDRLTQVQSVQGVSRKAQQIQGELNQMYSDERIKLAEQFGKPGEADQLRATRAQKEAELNQLRSQAQSVAGFGDRYGGGSKYLDRELAAQLRLANTNLSAFNAQDPLAEYQTGLATIEDSRKAAEDAERNAWRQSQIDEAMAKAAPTDQEISEFARLRSGIYGGPKELKDAQTLAGQAEQVEQIGELARLGAGGQQELLRQFIGKTGYTPGQQRMDALLLGQSNSGALRGAARESRQSLDKVQATNEQARQYAQELTGRAKAFGEETVGQLQGVRGQFSEALDKKLAETQGKEATRSSQLKNIQDLLTGKATGAQSLDKITRAGLGLQEAFNQGIITEEQAGQLLGDKGLFARAEAAGLDTNALIAERIKDIQAQNLNRAGVATSAEETRLSAIDRLLGRQGADVEFGTQQADLAAGRGQLDLTSLEDYIKKTEAAKGIQTPEGSMSMVAGRPTALSEAVSGAGDYLSTPGRVLGSVFDGGTSLDFKTMLTEAGNALQGAGQGVIGAAQFGTNSRDAIIEGLLKTNIGGRSLGQTEGGKQLLRALDVQNRLTNDAYAEGNQYLSEASSGIEALTKGNILDAAKSLSGFNSIGKIAGNVGKAVSTALGGGKTGNWATEKLNMRLPGNKEKVKVGAFANANSNDIIKQLNYINTPEFKSFYKDKNEITKMTNKMIEYYNKAKARETAAKAKLPRVSTEKK